MPRPISREIRVFSPPEAFYGHPFSLITAIQYTRTVPSLVDTYLRIIPKTKVLVFNGDLDPCVPYNGNEEWTRGILFPLGLFWGCFGSILRAFPPPAPVTLHTPGAMLF